MCNAPLYLTQFQNMLGLDYASIADNLTRELLVIVLTMPEAREQIKEIRNAAKCIKKAIPEDLGDDFQDIEEEDEEEEEDTSGGFDWSNFSADEISETADAVKDCTSAIDKYSIGEISGRLFVELFNTELQPLNM